MKSVEMFFLIMPQSINLRIFQIKSWQVGQNQDQMVLEQSFIESLIILGWEIILEIKISKMIS